ncbi:hypothetical protein [Pimelobacter simplex]|uniref:hypothetical protein n=1 Tax=Nocardioides simplex TaxID=2045 RepID=UPI00214F947A|nr:hypothetical protein [Pimelobacter simplex]UUW88848.1 hypothetical protein M0M43_24370 [Pimelobacter simplex]UUW98353.1 hypothetical protein M0M48_13020 [Pimelobacter simplex]
MRARALSSALVAALLLLFAPLASAAAPTAPATQAAGTGTISGTVTVPHGYDVRAVRILATPAGTPTGVVGAPGTWVRPDGTFDLTGLAPGQYNVAFGTYWSDMNPCSSSRDRWWTAPGQATGICTNDVLTGAGVVTVTDAGVTDLGTTPVLTAFTPHRFGGRVVAAPGRTTAGLRAEVWHEGDGIWNIPGGWYRLTGVPAQVLDATGTFGFDLVDPLGSNRLAIRFVDAAGQGYAFSFGTGGLTVATPGASGADFGTGSTGLLAVPWARTGDIDTGALPLKLPVGYASGGVTLSGAHEWGRTLTAHSTVVWSDPAVGTDFQWYRNGVAIDGAVGPSYLLDGLDDGWEAGISARAVPAGPWASTGPPADSAVAVIENTTPYNAAPPSVSGRAEYGARLTAGPGTWRPSAGELTYRYQWFRGTTAIPGATTAAYTPGLSDLGRRLSVAVTAEHDPWFAGPATARSALTPAVAPAPMPASWVRRWPARSGSPRVGRTVRVGRPVLSAAGLAQRPTTTFQWYAGQRALPRATTPRLRITRALRGKVVTVVVTVRKPGYEPRSRTVRLGRAR